MSRNINMKNVAGFHSLDFGAVDSLDLDRFRKGFGTRLLQKAGCVILWMLEE